VYPYVCRFKTILEILEILEILDAVRAAAGRDRRVSGEGTGVLAPVCPLSKTRSARPGFPNPASRWSFYGGESVCVFSGAAALLE